MSNRTRTYFFQAEIEYMTKHVLDTFLFVLHTSPGLGSLGLDLAQTPHSRGTVPLLRHWVFRLAQLNKGWPGGDYDLIFTVLTHLANLPHLFLGGLPKPPDPWLLPPWGWSTGFIASPLTVGLIPNHLFTPALPFFCL